MNLLIWGGPVNKSNLASVALPEDTQVLVLNQGPDGGIGSSSFGLLAASYRDSSGRILPSLLAAHGLSRDSFDKVVLAGFSAFHGLAAALLETDADLVDGMVALDSCFSSPGALTKPGYVRFANMAASGSKFFVLTASAGGGAGSGAAIGPGVPDYSTGYECVLANVADAAPEPMPPSDVPDGVPPPEAYYHSGGLFVLDYRGRFTHGDHVNKIGPSILNGFLVPYLDGSLSLGFPWGKVASATAGAVAGFLLFRYALR